MDKKKVKELIEKTIRFTKVTDDDYIQGNVKSHIINTLQVALKELSRSDWVSVEDGLPPYGENVLAISKDEYMNVSYRRKIPRDKISREVMDDNGFILNFNLHCSTITHWKPIDKLEE